MTKCSLCGNDLKPENLKAAISGSVMGDEYTDVFFFCVDCDVYTKISCREKFGGEDIYYPAETVTREEGDEKVKFIKQCQDPTEKRCRCPIHREWFGSWLD